MTTGEAITSVTFAVIGPGMLWFFARNLWQAGTSGTILGGPRYAPRQVERVAEPRLFKVAVATHAIGLTTVAIITVAVCFKLLRWLDVLG